MMKTRPDQAAREPALIHRGVNGKSFAVGLHFHRGTPRGVLRGAALSLVRPAYIREIGYDMTPNDCDQRGASRRHRYSWWRGGVIYQIYPRSFSRTAHGRRHRRSCRHRSRLPHVASLNVDAIWISPFFTADEGLRL
jgi:hypothetical protein